MKTKYARMLAAVLLLSMVLGMLPGCRREDRPQVESIPETVPTESPGSDGAEEIPETEPITALAAFTNRQICSQSDALAAIQEMSVATGITNVAQTLGECREYAAMDSVFYRFSQVYEGIPVYGRSVTVGASAQGESQGLSHNYLHITDVETAPSVDEADAREIVAGRYGSDAQISGGSLSIYSLYGARPTLAWQFSVTGPALQDTCFVDARSGTVLAAFSGILTDTEVGTYTDSNGSIVFSTLRNEDGTYSLIDEARNFSVYDADYRTVSRAVVDDRGNVYRYDPDREDYFDAEGNRVFVPGDNADYGTWEVLDANGNVVGRNADLMPCAGSPLAPLKVMTNPSTAWSSQKAAAAMSLSADVYDFYLEVLDRKGFNGKNGPVRITVNDDINNDPGNAYSAEGSSRAFTFLNFGHEITITIDLVGHEFTHSVEQSTSGMIYHGESGAVMEGLSDVFGELAEDWIGDSELDGDCDWVHGSRNMIDPSANQWSGCHYLMLDPDGTCPVAEKNGQHLSDKNKVTAPAWYWWGSCYVSYPYPDTYRGEGYCTEEYDSNGVHFNSTVISHAAYLMTHPESAADMPLTNEELARVLHYAMGYLPADCSFEDFAAYVCLAAEVLKLSEKKQECIVHAFTGVGIEAKDVLLVQTSGGMLDYMVTEVSEWNVYGANGSLCGSYTLAVSGKEPLQNLYHTGAYDEADSTVTEYQVTEPGPLTLNLDPGYMYDFEFTDGEDPDKTFACEVGVYADSLGLTEIIDLRTDFGDALALNAQNLMMLTERPGAERPGLFTVREFDLDGYVYEADSGGYSIETICPAELGQVAYFFGDFKHCGEDTEFTVHKYWSSMTGRESLWMQIKNPGTHNIGLNALSMFTDKETYYYIIDGEDAAYLVCESVEYDVFSAGNGAYTYKKGETFGADRTETISIWNMNNDAQLIFTVSYDAEGKYVIFKETKKLSVAENETTSLFILGYNNEGKYASREEMILHIKGALAPYGLSDRVFSQSSSLSGYTPVFTATVTGEPKAGNVWDSESAAIRARATVGYPTYTGRWSPEGVVKGGQTIPEQSPAMTDAERYQNFLNDGGYLGDWNYAIDASYYPPESYCFLDINQDGTDELVIISENDGGFHGFLVYTIDDTGAVTRLKVGRSETECDINHCYADLRYSPEYRALVFSETRSTAMYGGVEYFAVSDGGLHSVGGVGFDSTGSEGKTVYHSSLNGVDREITEAEQDACIARLQWLEYQPLP